MVEERGPESSVKEVVGHRELLCELPFREEGRIIIAEHQARVRAPGGVFVHFAAVDLVLLLVNHDQMVDLVQWPCSLGCGRNYWRKHDASKRSYYSDGAE